MRRARGGVAAPAALWGGLFAALFFVYVLSPNLFYAEGDPRYTVLLAENLLRGDGFALDAFFAPPLDAERHGPLPPDGGLPYQVHVARGHVYYFYPWGSSLLSVPVMLVLRPLGFSAVDAAGAYDPVGEVRVQRLLAALLAAAAAMLIVAIARVYVARGAALVIGAAAGLGTSLWSAASRGLFSETWSLVLLGAAVWMLASHARDVDRPHVVPLPVPRAVVLASLLGALYFCRPTNALAILLISGFAGATILRRSPRGLAAFAITGAAWLALFLAMSRATLGTWLPPNYQRGAFLRASYLLDGLPGVLVSPGFGLFVYSPMLLYVVWLVVRHRRHLPHLPLAALAAVAILGEAVVAGLWPLWWGGWVYGPKLLAGTIPWWGLLAAQGLAARGLAARGLAARAASEGSHAEGARARSPLRAHAVLLALIALSAALHAPGALSPHVLPWMARHLDQLDVADRLWRPRLAPFLAGWVGEPDLAPLLRLDASPACDAHFVSGWASHDGTAPRRTSAARAVIAFDLAVNAAPGDRTFYGWFHPAPNCTAPGRRATLTLNGRTIAALDLTHAWQPRWRAPAGGLRPGRNELVIELPDTSDTPDATAPSLVVEALELR